MNHSIKATTARSRVPVRAVSRERLTDQTAAALREYIVENRLKPGTQLPTEPELAESLGVSRNVVRQAVASLQVLGMLRVAQGSGTFVADVADTDVFAQIAIWMGPESVTEQQYFEVREIWERGIYELLLHRIQPADLDRLDELATAMVAAHDPDELANIHREFHDVILRASDNPFLVTLGTILQRFFWEFGYREGVVNRPPMPRLRESHRSIVAMLRSRDSTQIQRAIDLHLSPHLCEDETNTPPTASAAMPTKKGRA